MKQSSNPAIQKSNFRSLLDIRSYEIGSLARPPNKAARAAATAALPITVALWANLVIGSQWWLLAEFRLFFSVMSLLCVFNLSP
jgi:hypothetical protein